MRAVLVTAVISGGLAAGYFCSGHSSAVAAPQPAGADPEPRKPYGVGKAAFAQRASTSCASAACHGGGHPGKPGSEYSTWAPEAFPEGPSDPHARAYSVLFNPVSVQMGEKLGIKEPHKSQACLKCHAVDGAKDAETQAQMHAEGVGCGACHGPSDQWISIHTLPEWKALSPREKWDKYGFVPSKNLVARSLNCAGCHVGDAEREVNHDLIAAGHPRLAFENARFHTAPTYRKHWVEKYPQPDFEVRAWLVGQVATLRAATELLRVRAERAIGGDGIWPELAGLSCYACHQKVGAAELRGVASDSPRPAGVAGWEVWSNAAAGVAADSCGLAFPGVSSPTLIETRKLRAMMEEKRPPAAKRVADQARLAVAELDVWLVALQDAEDRGLPRVEPKAPQQIAHALATNALSKDGTKLRDHDWDALAANYLGCAAMYHASGGAAANKWTKELTTIRDGLRFPTSRDARFNSPADFDLKKLMTLRTNFELLRDATAPRGGNQ